MANAGFKPRTHTLFVQAEDGIRDYKVTAVQTCALPIYSIALGSAIGIFFGFTPLYPLKTILSIAIAWVLRCNKIAAAIAVTLHDALIFAMPAIYFADRKSTRLNSSHLGISYAVFCLKKS